VRRWRQRPVSWGGRQRCGGAPTEEGVGGVPFCDSAGAGARRTGLAAVSHGGGGGDGVRRWGGGHTVTKSQDGGGVRFGWSDKGGGGKSMGRTAAPSQTEREKERNGGGSDAR
jgi:hypothetical protein